MNIKEWFKVLTLSPRFRLQRHIDYLHKHIKITREPDKKNFEKIHEEFNKTNNQLRAYQAVRTIIFVFLYISLITAIAKGINPTLVLILKPLVQLTALIGVTLLTVVFLFLQRIINAIYAELYAQHAHLVALAVKNNDHVYVHPEFKLGLFEAYKE